jgi:molybdopterin molybdotransferase
MNFITFTRPNLMRMISVTEALEHVKSNTEKQATITVSVADAGGHYLAETILAPIDHPIFDQSAVDGYAFKIGDINAPIEVTHEVAAGTPPTVVIEAGQAHRIFTGAAVSPGTEAVAMQEDTDRDSNKVRINKTDIQSGANIRRKGEQIRTGATALEAGTYLNAAAIGFLASMGVATVQVVSKPNVGVIVSGSEFATSAEDLKQGKIYESNGSMLMTALKENGCEGQYHTCVDDQELLKTAFSEYAEAHELLLITGGVSVGDYDYTRPTLEALGYEIIFHKVNQKPGKPLLFARKGNKLAFGLPGNPRAVLICFYQYVLPALRAMSGSLQTDLTTVQLPLTTDLKKRDNKTHFLAAQLDGNGVKPLGKQLSHMLQSMAFAQALIRFDAEHQHLEKGQLVDVQLLPQTLYA